MRRYPVRQNPIIMVAVDFSEHSSAALEYAHQLAGRLDGTLILVNVYNERDIRAIQYALGTYDPALCRKRIDDGIEDRRTRLGEWEKEHGAQARVVTRIVRIGVPYQELLTAIEEEGPDVLVMGTKGRSNLADSVLGSCALKMFRRCPVPLLTLRSDIIE
jgi:nucleotide-binding universal stress UspA family protein